MDSRGQHLCTSGSEVSSSASLSAPSLALEDVALAPSVEPQVFPHLRPLIVKMPGVSGGFRGELFARGDVLGQTYSPKGLVQNMMQPARPQPPVARLGDLSGYPQYEDFAGILGDRLASGSLSDVSVSAMSERAQICSSGHSSSGENTGPRLKFMCSFGGKILPRPVDGKLRYVGGDTRIISIHRHTNYTTLLHKMRHIYGREVILKYQLPNEDLDALITILSDEDVENMMEEYDKLEACEPSSRLRIFLFSPADYNVNSLSGLNDSRNTDQLYVDTINGIPEPSLMKHTDTVTVSCANALTGVDVADTWSGPLFVKNVSVALPVAPMLQVTGACIKPMPVAMPSYTKQVVLRNVSASPSMPSSPTISSQLAQAKQCTIPDLSSHVYADQSAKTPITHFHEMQRLDAIYQEIEGARSASSSLGSQHDGVYQPLELKRVMDPSLVAQHDSSIEQSCRLEQDPMMSRVDSHLPRMLRVNSHGNLVPVMQQHIEVEAPSLTLDRQLESNLADISHPLSNFQTFTLQQEVPSSQVGWQHALESRRPGYQGMDMMHLTTLENVQAHQPVLNQQMAPQYFLPGGIPSQEVAYLRPVEQPVQLAYPPTLLQSSTAPGMVAIPSSMIHPGSAPQSPRVIPQESKLNQSMAPQYATGQRSFIRSQVDQSFARTAVHSNFHQANRVFKPLNTHLEHQEQVLRVVDGPIRQHPPAPVSKVEEMQTANNLLINEGEPLQSCFVDGLTRPMVPPYPGAGLYPDHATVFEDRGVIRNDDQMHAYEQDDGFSVQSQYQGAVDWAWKRGHNEDNIHGWAQGNHLDPQGELNLGSSGITGKPSIPMDGVGMQMLETAFVTTAANDTHLTTNEHSGIHLNVGLQAQRPLQMENDLTGLLAPSSLYKDTATVNPLVMPILSKPDEKLHAESGLSLFLPQTVSNESRPDSTLMGHLDDISFRIAGDATSNGGTSNHAFGLSDTLSPRSADTVNEKFSSYSLLNHDNHLPNMQTIPSSSPSSPGGSIGNSNLGMKAVPSNITLPTGISASAAVSSTIGGPPIPFVFDSSIVSSSSMDVHDNTMPRNSLPKTLRENEESVPVKAEMLFSEIAKLTDTTNAMLASSFQVLNSTERKGDYPRFDSDTLDGTGNLNHKYDNVGCNVELAVKDVNASTIYSAPTLSLQNWEESLAKVALEEAAAIDPIKDEVDEGTLAAVQKDIEELKIGLDNGIGDENVGNKLSLAAQAEEEAISRGLQTIKNADLEELRELGTGTFGTVYHGKWRGTDVAIKRIKSSCFTGRPSERERLLCDFWREAFILGQLHHPNVVAFYGVVPDGPGDTLATVTEYMVNGSLKQVLQKKDRTIDRRKRLLIIMDAAFGMEYLHGKNIVHFDLKCENLLVNMKDPHRPICKVGDLGLSKVKHQTMVSGGVRGTLPWMAPELLNGSDSLVSEKVDVFSFGIVMWELLTGEEPYANMHYGAIIGGIVNNTLRPPVPSWCDPSWKSLMERCWSADPAQRPGFLEVAAELRSMANAKSQGQAPPQASASV